ncbi:MAG: sugar MFS transporter [Terriglobales bacterium]|jgi:MFS transporter, FHS family, L-fucose permease
MPTNVSTETQLETFTKAPPTAHRGPLAIVTTLFFMWGSLTSLNDVLIPYAQHVFNLRLAASMLIQTAFFSAYFVFSIPSAKIIDWLGYKRAIVVGLLTMVVACLGFYPAARIPSFPFFLTALIVLATGITILQVAANPYVAVLGNPQTASSRLNLTQAFNSLGTAVFPWIGARVILGTTSAAIAQSTSQEANAIVKLYVYFFAVALCILAIGIGMSKLPKIESAEHRIGEKVNDSLWKHPNLVFGAIGIFVYVGGEVAIGSSIANYLALPSIGGFASSIADPAPRYHAALGEAARYISLYWLGAMIGRFVGSAILQKVKAGKLLALCAVMAALLVSVSVLTSGHVAMWSILAVGLFNSVMFPCIFTMGIAELGPLTGDGSGILNMAIVGGAIIPWLVGKAADLINRAYYPAMVQGATSWGQGIHYALVAATICYLYILFFAVSGSKPNSERYAKA